MPIVNSDVFPNLRIDSSIKPVFDPLLQQLKDCQDPQVKRFANVVARMDYQIENGSPKGTDLCETLRDATAKVIKLPPDIVGTYLGRDGMQHPNSLARILMHELSHAASDLDFDLPQNQALMMHLMRLKMEAEQQGKGADFPTNAAFEAMAVETENFLVERVFHLGHPRHNVTDKGLNFSVQDLRNWELKGYPADIECVDPLSQLNSKHAQSETNASRFDALQTKFLAQIHEMTPDAQNILIAQFNHRWNQQSFEYSL